MPVRAVMITAGARHLRGFLQLLEQRELAQACLRLGEEAAGFYQPVLRGGARMHLRMLCLGKHWNAKRYVYQAVREDVDGLPVQEMPPMLANLARRTAEAAEMSIRPDVGLVNHYSGDGRLGLHQDKDERPETLISGVPVVSISLGDDAEFLFGGTSRQDPVRKIVLRSGDAFVFGGPARMCYHGVRRVFEGTGPIELGLAGRINITIRQY